MRLLMPQQQRAAGAEPARGESWVQFLTRRAGRAPVRSRREQNPAGREGALPPACVLPRAPAAPVLWGPGDLAEARGRDGGGTGLSAVLTTGSEARTLHLGDGGTFLLEPLLGGPQSPLVLDFVP